MDVLTSLAILVVYAFALGFSGIESAKCNREFDCMPPPQCIQLARHCRHSFNRLERRRLSSQASAPEVQPRLKRLNARLPRFLHRYTTPLLTAPVTHITSFLLLHEVTAVIPLFALAGLFHYSQWMPPFISEGKWVADGVRKFGDWFRKKGWLGEVPTVGQDGQEGKIGRRGKWWDRGEGSVRVVVE